jgi:hypothetical protein
MSGAPIDAPTDGSAPSSGAVRMARHRSRRKDGLRCLTIELRQTEVEALISGRHLAPDQRNDRGAVRQALYEFLDMALR